MLAKQIEKICYIRVHCFVLVVLVDDVCGAECYNKGSGGLMPEYYNGMPTQGMPCVAAGCSIVKI